MLLRRDVVTPVTMEDYGTFAPSESERVPEEYIVPAHLTDVIQKLQDHGVTLTRIAEDVRMQVEEFHLDSTHVAEREFQQHRERTLFGSYQVVEMEVSAGSFMVSTSQPLGRLVFSLLEPRSDDGFVNWNVLDRTLEGADVYPIRRR